MKTGARLVLEKRFRQWANGKRRVACSAALLLGLTLTSLPADAQSICSPFDGYGGTATVDVYVNDQFVATRGLLSPPPVDSQGKQYIDLTGTFGPGGAGGAFTIAAIPDGRPDPPRVFLDPGSGGVSLLVATDMLVSADALGTLGKLTLVLDSQRSFGTCPGGAHTYGLTMDGAVLGPNPTATIEVTGRAVIGEASDVINLIPAGTTDVGPSLIAGTPAAPLKPGGLFTGAVTESIACGTTDGLNCPLQIRNSITMTFTNPGDLLYASGSFGAAAAVAPGTGNEALVLGATGIPFDTFNAAVANQPLRNTFEVGALLKLGALSDGINPPAEKFSMRIGDFAATLGPGSFVARRFFGINFYIFDGIVGGFPFKVVITPLFENKVSLVVAGHGADLRPGTAILDVAIGDDKGSTPARVFNVPW